MGKMKTLQGVALGGRSQPMVRRGYTVFIDDSLSSMELDDVRYHAYFAPETFTTYLRVSMEDFERLKESMMVT